MENILFNKPHLTGKEAHYMYDAVHIGKLSGNGKYTKKCQAFFEETYDFRKCLLTTSCTDALEMSALLLNIQPEDEVIMPSFTFVSTANAFMLRGAKIVFADSRPDQPNIDETKLEELITPKTKAIVVVHYAGVACEMDAIMALAEKYNIAVVEDAAHAIDAHYKGKPLGGIGHLAAFSFHETKNIISGEGGMLVINDPRYADRAEIIWEKGTNRSAFFRGEVDKYGWVDIGSSFLPSETVAAFLYAQIEHLKEIQNERIRLWNLYHNALHNLEKQGKIKLPYIPDYAENNAHMFYVLCRNITERTDLIQSLKSKNINAVFHYLPLHLAPYFKGKHDDGRKLPETVRYADTLLRLPLFVGLTEQDIKRVVDHIYWFFKS